MRGKRTAGALVLLFGCCAFFWSAEPLDVMAGQRTDSFHEKIKMGSALRQDLLELSGEFPEVKEILKEPEHYPTELLEALCENPEILEFVLGYPEADTKTPGRIQKEEVEEGIPLFLQWDTRWGYLPYGGNMLAATGCGPTCLSMVVAGLTGNVAASPDALARAAEEGGYYQEGVGTEWAFLMEGGREFGVQAEELPLNRERVFSSLEQKHPIICSVRPGDFTKGGHFLVLTGVENGKIRIHDPNSRANSERLWTYERLKPQIKNLWAYSLEEKDSETEDPGEKASEAKGGEEQETQKEEKNEISENREMPAAGGQRDCPGLRRFPWQDPGRIWKIFG